MAKMTLNPSKKVVDEFINRAGHTDNSYPWDAPDVREDSYKNVALRLPEPYAIKLQWLSEQTGIAQQRLLRDVLIPWIDEKVEEISRD